MGRDPTGVIPRGLLLALPLAWLATCAEPAPTPGPEPVDREARRRAIHAEVRSFVEDLEAGGDYDCCIKSPCSHCAMMAGGCKCEEGLARGEPVCEECALMWTRGQGKTPGVDPDSVRSFLEAERAMK